MCSIGRPHGADGRYVPKGTHQVRGLFELALLSTLGPPQCAGLSADSR